MNAEDLAKTNYDNISDLKSRVAVIENDYMHLKEFLTEILERVKKYEDIPHRIQMLTKKVDDLVDQMDWYSRFSIISRKGLSIIAFISTVTGIVVYLINVFHHLPPPG